MTDLLYNILMNIPTIGHFSYKELTEVKHVILTPIVNYNPDFPVFVCRNFDENCQYLGNFLMNPKSGVIERDTKEPYFTGYRISDKRPRKTIKGKDVGERGVMVLGEKGPLLVFKPPHRNVVLGIELFSLVGVHTLNFTRSDAEFKKSFMG